MEKSIPQNPLSPAPLLEMSGYYWKTCTLHTAVKLDIFTRLGEASATPESLARELFANVDALERLLNALVALEFLSKEGDNFFNTPLASLFLSKASPRYVGFMILHHYHLMDSWHRMEESILSGKPVGGQDVDDEEWRESFLMGMFNIAMAVAPDLSHTLDFSSATRLLDFGGGPGTFAVHFCQANPNLLATVYDLPTTRSFAEKIINRFSLDHRVDFMAGDFEEEDFPAPGAFDLAWLSHVLHGQPPEMATAVVGRAVSALKPGSRIYIHEFILNNTADAPQFPVLFSLNMLVEVPGGRSYTEAQLRGMLETHGVVDITRHPFVGPMESGILYGIVQ